MMLFDHLKTTFFKLKKEYSNIKIMKIIFFCSIKTFFYSIKLKRTSKYEIKIIFIGVLYKQIKNKKIIKEIIIKTSLNEMEKFISKNESLESFHKKIINSQIMEKNEFKIIISNKEKFAFKITKCIIYEIMKELKTTEITKYFCQVDKIFFEKYFKNYQFSRGKSWKNTISYGKKECNFIFTKK